MKSVSVVSCHKFTKTFEGFLIVEIHKVGDMLSTSTIGDGRVMHRMLGGAGGIILLCNRSTHLHWIDMQNLSPILQCSATSSSYNRHVTMFLKKEIPLDLYLLATLLLIQNTINWQRWSVVWVNKQKAYCQVTQFITVALWISNNYSPIKWNVRKDILEWKFKIVATGLHFGTIIWICFIVPSIMYPRVTTWSTLEEDQ